MKIYIIPLIITLIVITLIYNIISIINAIQKEKRIAAFSLSKKDIKDDSLGRNISESFWNFIHFFSNHLGKSNLLLALSSDYEKYILVDEERYKSSIDYITVKILLIIIFVILDIIFVLFGLISRNIFLLIVFMLAGYYLPDLIWSIIYNKRCYQISLKLYESIIVIDDNLENMTIENAIKKVINSFNGPIVDEYKKILIDLSYNLSLTQAFKRFYERTRIAEVNMIYHLFYMNAIDIETFHVIRNQITYYDKLNHSKMNILNTLDILSSIFLLIPVIFIIIMSFIYPNIFLNLFKSINGCLLFLLFIFLYIVLILVLRKIKEVKI